MQIIKKQNAWIFLMLVKTEISELKNWKMWIQNCHTNIFSWKCFCSFQWCLMSSSFSKSIEWKDFFSEFIYKCSSLYIFVIVWNILSIQRNERDHLSSVFGMKGVLMHISAFHCRRMLSCGLLTENGRGYIWYRQSNDIV